MNTPQGQLSTLALKTADLLLLLFALLLTEIINHAPDSELGVYDYSVNFLSTRIKLSNAILCGSLLIVWHIFFNVRGLYRSHRLRSLREEIKQVTQAAALCASILLIAAQIGGWKTIDFFVVVGFWGFAVLFCGGIRFASRRFLRILRRRGRYLKTLLVIGGGQRAEQFAELLSKRKDLGYRLLGFVDSDSVYRNRNLAGAEWMGTLEDLPEIVAREAIDDVAVALPIKSHYSEIQKVISLLDEQGIAVHLLSDFFPRQLSRCQSLEFEGEPLLFFHSAPPFSWRTEVKRLIDLIGSTVLLVLFAPLLAIISILIKFDSPGPVFFVQERMGYNKRRFRMIKFRTMVPDAEARMKEIEHLNEKDGAIFKMKNDPRVTRLGRILRKTSLDELPQLINVLLGDMSLVGPRPLSIRDALRLEKSWQKRRFSVRPGLTCLWQISGRSNLSFEQWMQLDLEYIDHWSLLLDWWILLRTIPAVLTSRGAV
ncbi:MAG TPA: sugar transferase [Pyrinomonadaceae bacterium]|jgi:exopolysaccharide biosynthesis polyprenyl glycosylphosphotransferase